MRLFFTMLDDSILRLFTAFSHWFQRLTSRTNFFLAKIALTLVLIWGVVRIGNYFIPVLPAESDVLDLIFFSFLSLFVLEKFVQLDKAETLTLNTEKTKYFFGPLLHQRWFRLIFVLVLVVCPIDPDNVFARMAQPKGILFFKVVELFGILAFMAFLYLINVDPLPPAKSKVKAWIEALQASIKKLAPSGARVQSCQLSVR